MRLALRICLAAILLSCAGYGLYRYTNRPLLTPFAPEKTDQHFLLTFPRSGTNLTSCYIQALARKPIWFMDQHAPHRRANNRLDLKLDYTKTPLYRSHFHMPLKGMNKNGNKLLLILRNYKECIHRENTKIHSNEEFRDLFVKEEQIVKTYLNNLAMYDSWDPANRLLIYYEDLIKTPVEQTKRILSFFDEPIPDFLTDDFLRSISGSTLESYHAQHKKSGGSHSKGKDLEFHSKQIPNEYLVEIDQKMESLSANLWDTYLKKYKSNF